MSDLSHRTEERRMSTPDLLATCWTTAGDAVPLPGRDDSPVPLPERIAAAGRAGFTGFGVVHNDLAIYLRDGDLPTLAATLRDNGMRHVELEFLTDWWQPVGTPERAASDAVLDLLLRATDVLHPHHVKVGPDIHGGPYDLETYAREWTRISQAFGDAGTVIALEFMAFSNIPTVARAVELVRASGHPAGGLMMDMWHIWRGGAEQVEQIADVPLELITGVELDDGTAEPTLDGAYQETVLRRDIPGQGEMPVARMIELLLLKGWTGPWGIEILSETYRVRPLDEALGEVVRDTLAQFELAGAGAR
ncbi:sugar phosphate isomerase/epimerase family protein [Angustibacter aerolatus]